MLSLDQKFLKNPTQVSIYCKEIFKFYIKEEEHYLVALNENVNKELKAELRFHIIDDFVRWHYIFNMRQETLFLAIYIFDKYTNMISIKRSDLNTLCITCLFIACKFEEVKIYRLDIFIQNLRNKVNKEDVLELEGKILSLIDFKLTIVSPYDFLKRLFHINDSSQQFCKLIRSSCLLYSGIIFI